MGLKVLGISTSPRRDGNSDLLLQRALAGAREANADVEHMRACDYRIAGCDECGECSVMGKCRVQDDYPQILDKMLAADRIIFAAPVFFLTVSAQAKLLIDRGQCLWMRENVLGLPLFESKRDRRGMFIAVGGSRGKRQFQCVRRPILSCFKYLEVRCVSSLCINQVDEKGTILSRPDALEHAFRLGRELADPAAPLPEKPVDISLF
jgi:multimeric flavodoxin WrbA